MTRTDDALGAARHGRLCEALAAGVVGGKNGTVAADLRASKQRALDPQCRLRYGNSGQDSTELLRWGSPMKRSFLASTALCAVLAPNAYAADLPTVKGPPPAPSMAATPFSWTGFYIGGNVGGLWSQDSVTTDFGFRRARIRWTPRGSSAAFRRDTITSSRTSSSASRAISTGRARKRATPGCSASRTSPIRRACRSSAMCGFAPATRLTASCHT